MQLNVLKLAKILVLTSQTNWKTYNCTFLLKDRNTKYHNEIYGIRLGRLDSIDGLIPKTQENNISNVTLTEQDASPD